MKIENFVGILLAAVILVACGSSAVTSIDVTTVPADKVSFSKDILPIFQNNCVNCHGGGNPRAGLDLSSYASVMAGSSNGAVIVPGDPAGSKLIQYVQTGRMPKGGGPLPAGEIQTLTNWVQAGAPNN
jgi:hypothetical protein